MVAKLKGSLSSALEHIKMTVNKSDRPSNDPKVPNTLTKSSYAKSSVVYAQSQAIYTQPQFYSPLHTAQNWQIPQKRREVYQWMFLNPCELVTKDFTFKDISTLSMDLSKTIKDTITGGIMFEDINCEPILSSSGNFRKPRRFSSRECINKKSLEIKCFGNWRTLNISNDHIQVFLDGDKFRNNCGWTRMIEKCTANHLGLDDFLLVPCPKIGEETISLEDCKKIAKMVLKNTSETNCSYISTKGSCCVFSEKVFSLNRNSILGILSGIFDYLGTKDNQGKVSLKLKNKNLSDQIYFMLLSVGMRSFIDKEKDVTDTFCISVPILDMEKLKSFLTSYNSDLNESTPESDSKIFFYEEGNVTYLAQSIEYIKKYYYTGNGFDIQVDPEREFVANGYVSSNCRYFYEHEPKVGGAIDFYSSFPINGFETQCQNSRVKSYIDFKNKKLNMDYWLKMISKEYFVIGDVFPFAEVECEECNGSGISKKDNKKCSHPGGSFRRLVVLNPDWIDVQVNVMADDPVISLMPDEELKRVVWYKRPKEIYDRLPTNIRQLISSGRPIPLANESISHLKYNPYPYGTYGTPIIKRLFKSLAYKDKLMTAQWIIAERLILPIRVVKVGDAERPAGAPDIADVQTQLAMVANDPNLTLVTHHAFDYDWIGANGKILQLTNEFEFVNKEILQGLMISDSLLSGEMASYQSAAIGAEAMIQRMESWRLELSRWVQDKIYLPMCQMRGYVNKEKSEEIGETDWIVPKIQWNDLNIRDDTQQKTLYNQLFDKGLLSGQTLMEKYGLDYDQEIERKRYEEASSQPIGGMPGAGGMGDMGGAGLGGMFGGGGAGGEAMPPMGGSPLGGEASPAGAIPGETLPQASPVSPTGAGGSIGKILKKGKESSEIKAPNEVSAQPMGIRLTSLEQKMFKMLTSMRIPLKFWAQYKLGPYRSDFAFPAIKLAIEVDGQKWHESPDDMAHDQLRDQTLSKYGWTIVRFGEIELKEKVEEVKKTISAIVYKCWKETLRKSKEQTENLMEKNSIFESMMETYGSKTEISQQ